MPTTRTRKLNPRWLRAAFVYNEDGSRFGVIAAIRGDELRVLTGGKEHVMSARKLDAQGRINKPGANCPKYL